MKDKILQYLPAECPWRDTLYWYDSTDSTNTRAKELGKAGAPHGTVVLAGKQTGGRGRMGRQFHSPENLGIYLSVILRPQCRAETLMHLTCAVAVAICDGVEKVCGVRPNIKWINDLVLSGRKLGGILTELSIDPATGMVDFAVVGIGINCRHQKEDFPEALQSIATSLAMEGLADDPAVLSAALIHALWDLSHTLGEKDARMDRYRRDCITLGKEITVHRADGVFPGTALDVDSDGGLLVRRKDGVVITVSSGEVSVRGLYSYI